MADFGMGPRRWIMFPLLGDGIFTQDGPDWKHSRELLRPQFSHRQYQDLELFREHVDNLIQQIPAEGGVVDLQPLFFRLTLDTTTAFLFGESVNSQNQASDATETTFGNAFNTAQEYIAKRFRLQDLYWLVGGKRFNTSCAVVHDFADKILERNLDQRSEQGEGRSERYVFLDAVAESSVNRKSLRDQMINILLAGRDTTACLLSWTFRLLVRHPEVLEKLREEVDVVIGRKPDIHREDLQRMKYLTNVLKETLRLFPSVPVNSRTALRTTFLPTGGGDDRQAPVLIPKGAAVAYSVYSLHRRPDLYGGDAEDFRPERWEENLGLFADETTTKWGYLPFNGGPRICLGSKYLDVYPFVHDQRLTSSFSGFRADRSSLYNCPNPPTLFYHQETRRRSSREDWKREANNDYGHLYYRWVQNKLQNMTR